MHNRPRLIYVWLNLSELSDLFSNASIYVCTALSLANLAQAAEGSDFDHILSGLSCDAILQVEQDRP